MRVTKRRQLYTHFFTVTFPTTTTEDEMMANTGNYEPSIHSLPGSEHETYPNQYGSIASVSTTGRPTLNIFANTRGDVAYEPDPSWSKAFNKTGYKINLHQVDYLGDIDQGPRRLHGQYAVQPNGALRVNGQRVPMLQSGTETRYTLDGFEHGRTYVHNSPYLLPTGEVRTQEGREWYGKRKAKVDVKCSRNKVLCGIGVIIAIVVACVAPLCCK